MRTLITGGCGFVGRHLTMRLLRAGDDVTVVDPIVPLTGGVHPSKWHTLPGMADAHPSDYQRFTYCDDDCREFFADPKHVGEHYDRVFHAAAMVGGRLMIENNPLAVAEDLSIDAMYWVWAKTARPGLTITFSSSAAYPVWMQTRHSHQSLSEDDIDFDRHHMGIPDLSYGWAKLTTEYIGRLAHQRHGLESITIRPFSGCGADQDMAYPFPSIVRRALLLPRYDPMHIWGSGEQVRDFIHIEDCVTGMLVAAGKIPSDGRAINLSTGVPTSFRDLAATVLVQIGRQSSPIVGQSDAPEGVFYRVGSTAMQESIGIRPSMSLEQIVSDGIRHLDAAR